MRLPAALCCHCARARSLCNLCSIVLQGEAGSCVSVRTARCRSKPLMHMCQHQVVGVRQVLLHGPHTIVHLNFIPTVPSRDPIVAMAYSTAAAANL